MGEERVTDEVRCNNLVYALSMYLTIDPNESHAANKLEAAVYALSRPIELQKGLIAGEIIGRVYERFKYTGAISLNDVHEILDLAQDWQCPPEYRAKLDGFRARCTEYVEQAFDIAINDKDMPFDSPDPGLER